MRPRSLAEMARLQRDLMERSVSSRPADSLDRPLRGVDRIELWNTFNLVLRRLAEKLVVGEIHDETVTVADQMEWLLARMRTERTFVFSSALRRGRHPAAAGGHLPRRARAHPPGQAAPAPGRGLRRHRLRAPPTKTRLKPRRTRPRWSCEQEEDRSAGRAPSSASASTTTTGTSASPPASSSPSSAARPRPTSA